MISFESAALRLTVDPANPLQFDGMLADRTIVEAGRQHFLVRFPDRVSEPVFLTEVQAVDVGSGRLAFQLADEDRTVVLRAEVASDQYGIRWHATVDADEPIWLVEWKAGDLHVDRMLVPALGGQELGREMPADVEAAYKYPFWWNAQFVVGALDDGSGVCLRTMEREPRLKVLRVRREDGFRIGLGFEADAPLTETRLEATWWLEGFDGGWERPVDRHRSWLESAFDLVERDAHPHMPPWAREINCILEIWGMSKERPDPLHTFDEMGDRIRAFAEYHDPEHTLLYLPGFAQGGIDSSAPDYSPAPKCGGREKFGQLVRTAHDLGYRVMVHTNVLALAYSHPLYDRFKDFQVVDAFGRRQGWGNDMDGDWLAEPYFAYMNPAYAEWRDHMEGVLDELIASFDLDAVFLDQTLLAFNTSPNFVEGMRAHVAHLQESFPDVLFAGEGLHEQMLPVLPVAQIHGIDSITGVHGMEGARDWRRIHPVSAYLFRPYCRLTAHLLTKHPSSPVFARQEEAYAQLDVIPALVLYDRSQPLEGHQLPRLLERARSLHTTHSERIP